MLKRYQTMSFILIPLGIISIACSNLFSQQFAKITGQPQVNDFAASRSVNWIDVNSDGYLDLFVTRGKSGGQDNMLYLNAGPPNYNLVAADTSIVSKDNEPSDGSSWGDVNNDGYPDLFVANWYNRNNLFYRNHGAGSNFWMERLPTTIIDNDHGYSETGSWGDYDNDGLLDLYVANSETPFANYLYHNLGNFEFAKISTGAAVADLGKSRGVTWVDFDNDGDMDLFVVREEIGDELLYKNMLKESGTATFSKITTGLLVTSAGNSWSGSWGDYDNDGRLDVFVTTQGAGGTCKLYHNDSGDSFSPIDAGALTNVVDSYGTASWVDYDNDGDLDIFITTAYAGSPSHCYLYKNNLIETGTASFTAITGESLTGDTGNWYGVSWGDYDEDGAPDVFVAGTQGENSKSIMYKNLITSNHYLYLDLVGSPSNKSGIGAHIRLKAVINGRNVWQLREVDGQSGYCGQNLTQGFGLGDATLVDSLIIVWPSGNVEVYTNLSSDRHLCLMEGDTSAPQLSGPSRGAANLPPVVTLQWASAVGRGPYFLQVSADSLFENTIVNDSTVSEGSYTLTGIEVSHEYFWRVRRMRSIRENDWSEVSYFTTGKPRVTISTSQRWNLVSLPLNTLDHHINAAFPNHDGVAYQFNGSTYLPVDSVGRLRGYWIRCGSDTSYTLLGDRDLVDTVSIVAGWNLIGSGAGPVAVSSLVVEPEGILESAFYGYSGRYSDAAVLVPGRGYWIKSTAEGRLIMNIPTGSASGEKP